MNTDNQTMENGFFALVECCRIVQVPWQIKGGFRVYASRVESCTVIVGTKSFTNRGEGCQLKSLKDAVLYMVDTYQSLQKFKPEISVEEEEHIQGLA